MNVFNLFAKLTLDNKDYEKGLEDSEKQSQSFSSKAGTAFKAAGRAIAAVGTAVVAAATGIANLALKTVEYGGDLDDNAMRIGMSTDAYQKWAFAMQLAGGDASTLQTAVRGLTTFTEQLSTGQGDALLTLQSLGIGYEDFMNMSVDERLDAIVRSLQDMENQTEMTTTAQDIFGSRAYQMLMPLLEQESDYMDNLSRQMEDYSMIMSEDAVKASAQLGDQIDFLTQRVKATGAEMMTGLFPAISQVVDGLMGMASGSEEASETFVAGIVSIINSAVNYLPRILNVVVDLLLDVIVALVDALPSMVPQLVDLIEQILFTIIDILPQLASSLFQLAKELIYALLQLDWATLIVELTTAIIDIAYIQLPNFIFDLIGMIVELFTTREGLNKIAEIGKAFGEAIINAILTIIESGVNLIIKAINAIFVDTLNKIDFLNLFDDIPKINPISIPRVDFAEGGIMDDLDIGTYYTVRAGEAGAEIVAQGRRGTGVANVEQIAEAQFMAMEWYDLRGAIRDAAVAIVNGLRTNVGNSEQNTNVVVRIGDKDFKSYVVNIVNETLRTRGRQSLNDVTSW